MADSLFETTFRVGEVVSAEPFEEARKPELAKLEIDLGDVRKSQSDFRSPSESQRDSEDDVVQSAAQTGYNYTPDELVGQQVLCATNLGTVNIAGYESEALTVGVPDDDGHPVLVAPDEAVPLGGALY